MYKKSLKIPKGLPESVNRRRTDNTMAKRKSTTGKTTINKHKSGNFTLHFWMWHSMVDKTLPKNLKVGQHEAQ